MSRQATKNSKRDWYKNPELNKIKVGRSIKTRQPTDTARECVAVMKANGTKTDTTQISTQTYSHASTRTPKH